MKQKYTITIADIAINVITEEATETVEALVGMVDRKMRELGMKSRSLGKTEAALLCALDYCSDKIKIQRKLRALESNLALTQSTLEELENENEALRAELDTLKGN